MDPLKNALIIKTNRNEKENGRVKKKAGVRGIIKYALRKIRTYDQRPQHQHH